MTRSGIFGTSSLALLFAALLTATLAQSQTPTSSKQVPFDCVPRGKNLAKPPPFLPGATRLGAKTPKQTGEKAAQLKPLCGRDMIPVPRSRYTPRHFKANPLIGPLKGARPTAPADAAALIRKNLRLPNAIFVDHRQYKKSGRRPLPDPAGGTCTGVEYYGACYYYANAGYAGTFDGGGMTFTIQRPATDGAHGHTLTEIALQGGPGNGNIVELGWNVDPEQYPTSDPYLFVFHWKNWTPTCYDACNWQQYSGTYFPGMSLGGLVGRNSYIGYVYYEGNWWAWFDNQWLGYFPGSEWDGAYTKASLIQWFGEVAISSGSAMPPKFDMGNGRFPSLLSANMQTLCDVVVRDWVCWYRNLHGIGATVPAYYDISGGGFGAARYGGPGE